MTRPRVSVVIPAYNYARFLPMAVDSALGQTVGDIDVVVVDDGSTDETPDLAARYADRVTWVRQERRGQSVARNLGLRRTRGDYILFLDADDALTPDAVAQRVEILDREPTLGWIFSDIYVTDAEGTVIGTCSEELRYRSRRCEGMIFSELLGGNYIPIHAALVRRTCLDAVGWFDESLVHLGAEDWDLWLRVARRFAIAYLDAPLGYYRKKPGSVTADRLNMALAILEVMALVEARWPDDVARVRRVWRRHRATQYLRAAIDLRPSLRRRDRLPWVWRAIRTRPVQGAAYRVLLRTLLRGGPVP